MAGFNLQPKEYVVMKSEGIRHGPPNLMSRNKSPISYKSDLVLTNESIVLIPKGMFGNTKGVQRFPLRDIKVIDGRPQAIANGDTLEVYFINRQEYFGFLRKNEVRAWAQNVSNVLTGDSEHFRSVQGVAYVAESVKDTLDTLKHSFRSKSKGERVAKRCISCGASISGVAGRLVRCQYCHTDQTLQAEG